MGGDFTSNVHCPRDDEPAVPTSHPNGSIPHPNAFSQLRGDGALGCCRRCRDRLVAKPTEWSSMGCPSRHMADATPTRPDSSADVFPWSRAQAWLSRQPSTIV